MTMTLDCKKLTEKNWVSDKTWHDGVSLGDPVGVPEGGHAFEFDVVELNLAVGPPGGLPRNIDITHFAAAAWWKSGWGRVDHLAVYNHLTRLWKTKV